MPYKDHEKAAAHDIPVRSLTIWYHLPFSIESGEPDMDMMRWTKAKRSASQDQQKYFHSFVTSALFPTDTKGPRIEHWERADLNPSASSAGQTETIIDMQADRDNGDGLTTHTYRARIDDVSLRLQRPDTAMTPLTPGMGILVVGLTLQSVSTSAPREFATSDLPGGQSLTLADAQNIIDWSRRAFARWNTTVGPKGAETPILGDMISRMRLLGHVDNGKWQAVDGLFSVAPWVKCLLKPWTAELDAVFFGDERAFVTSAITLEGLQEKTDRAAVLSIADADLFRLAEADPAGPDLPYQETFVKDMLASYRYKRHAPAQNGQSGNSTEILLAHHHQCLIGAGTFMEGALLNHTEQYYRHLQFICVYETFRLVQFSQRLTRIVERKSDQHPASDFAAELEKLRADFLEFTHLYHFSNVSLQLQPREMFKQLRKAMEIENLFQEVEEELRVATEFQQARDAKAAAGRAERLNDLLAFGVPLSLIAGLAGSNLFIGENHPSVAGASGGLDWWTQAQHMAGVVAAVSAVWAVATFWIAYRAGKSANSGQHPDKKYSHLGWFWGILSIVSVLISASGSLQSWLERLLGS
jgi:hypothetical protein